MYDDNKWTIIFKKSLRESLWAMVDLLFISLTLLWVGYNLSEKQLELAHTLFKQDSKLLTVVFIIGLFFLSQLLQMAFRGILLFLRAIFLFFRRGGFK